MKTTIAVPTHTVPPTVRMTTAMPLRPTPPIDLPPQPWDRLPTPPADPSQHLAFWQAVARALPIGRHADVAYVPTSAPAGEGAGLLVEERPPETPLAVAAEALDAPRLADLLDDPHLRAGLLAGNAPDAWLPQPPGDDDLHDGQARSSSSRESPLDAVLHRTLDVTPSNDPDAEHRGERWKAQAMLVQEAIVAMLLAAGEVPTPFTWLAIGHPDNPALVDRLMATGHAPMRMDHPYAQALEIASTALHLAVQNPNRSAADVVARLIAHGWSVNAPNRDGHTPLARAMSTARPGHPGVTRSIVEQLLDHGATVEWPGRAHHALSLAACAGNREAVDVLLERGHTHLLNRPGRENITPLNQALDARHVHLAEHLLACGAVPDAQTLPLARAVRERVGQGGMFGLPANDRAAWERVLVHLDAHALHDALKDEPGAPASPADDHDTESPSPSNGRRPRL